jgi:hypothetical protein
MDRIEEKKPIKKKKKGSSSWAWLAQARGCRVAHALGFCFFFLWGRRLIVHSLFKKTVGDASLTLLIF